MPRHGKHVARVVVAGKFGPRDRPGEPDRVADAEPGREPPQAAGIGTVADEQEHRVTHLGPHPRPGPDQGVLALAPDQPGHADHYRLCAEAQPVPDRGTARPGAEEGHVDAGRQPDHAFGRRSGQHTGQPDPDVLAQVGNHVDPVADAAEQATRER